MKFICFITILGLVTLAVGCAMPADWNRSVGATIRDVAKSRNVTEKEMVALFEVAWVESHVNNLNCGDSDRLGVFQQSPAQGWCRPSFLCLDVQYATHAFINKADRVGRPSMTPDQLAQAIQVSTYPKRYRTAESRARMIITALGGF